MTSEGARRAPCTDCETVIRQSAVVPQHRMEGDVPETVGERAAAVHLLKEYMVRRRRRKTKRSLAHLRPFPLAKDTRPHNEFSASVWEGMEKDALEC
jgi:hypothetical protein